MKKIKWMIYSISIVAISFMVSLLLFPKAKAPVNQAMPVKEKEVIQYVALGDSLTEGIGDEGMDGFVTKIADKMEEEFPVCVMTHNFGVSGDRSDQILKRLKESKTQQKEIKSADIITLTVGGNDFMQTLKKHWESISKKQMRNAIQTYTEQLELLYETIRSYNEHAVIYQVGIYNPFYYDLKNVQTLQSGINQWNSASQSIVATQKRSYFIPINDVISKGTKQDQINPDDEWKNHFISRDDHVHPNAQGYTMIANKVFRKIKETKTQWLNTTAP